MNGRQGFLACLAIVAGAIALSVLVVSVGADEQADADGRLQVTATTNFIADTVAEIGGDRVDVEALMGPGVDPHLYTATAGDVAVMRDADVIFYGGLQLEGKMEEVLERLAEVQTTVALTDAMPRDRLIEPPAGADEEYDPHVWFDPELWAYAVIAARDALIEADPDGAPIYERNAEAYLAELDELGRYGRKQISRIPPQQRLLITSHDAFEYFGRAFGLEVDSIQGISTTAEASTADIERIARLVSDRRLPAVFIESSVPQQTVDSVLAAAAELGASSRVGGELFSDAAGDGGTPEGTYLGMVRANIDTITEGLR